MHNIAFFFAAVRRKTVIVACHHIAFAICDNQMQESMPLTCIELNKMEGGPEKRKMLVKSLRSRMGVRGARGQQS